MRLSSIIVLDIRDHRIIQVSPVLRDIWDIVIWAFDIIDSGYRLWVFRRLSIQEHAIIKIIIIVILVLVFILRCTSPISMCGHVCGTKCRW